jgi:hypothetical protein
VMDLPFFSDFIDRSQGNLVQDSTGTSPGRCATATSALLRVVGLFIDSQRLVGDGALLDQAMVGAQLRCASRECWSWTAAAGFGGCRKS